MSDSNIGNALKLIKKAMDDGSFRKSLYRFETIDSLSDYLKEEGMYCIFNDFENAINKLKFDAKDKDEADEIDEIKNWWQYLLQTIRVQEVAL